jgi:hypothetical protein
MRRLLGGLVLAASWLAGIVLGVTGAALRTQTGREELVRWAVHTANGALGGTIAVGRVGGSFFGGLELEDVAVTHGDGSPVLTADLVGVQYRMRELLTGHIVLGALRVERPTITVVQPASGARFNFIDVIDPDPGGGDGGPSPLVAFHDVRLNGGRVLIKTPLGASPAPGTEIEQGPAGPLHVRRLNAVDAVIPYLRVASPEPGAPILARVAALRAEVSDPALDVRDLEGEVRVWGDSLRLDLTRVELPASTVALEGTIAWPTGPMLFDLRGTATAARTDDVRGLVAALPAGLTGRAEFTVQSHGEDVLEFAGTDLDVTGRGGGTMVGRLGMVLGPAETWRFQRTVLALERFDLEHVRGFLDTLPFAGTITGDVVMEGPATRLRLDIDATFTDALVEGTPQSYVRGRGPVSLLGEDFVFRSFVVDTADIAILTVRRLVPSIIVDGRIGGAGQLDGAWRNATFSGLVLHVDPPRPASRGRGFVRIDSRGDTVGIFAGLDFDSLRLEGFESLLDTVELGSAWAGRLRLDGYLDSLPVEAELAGPAGRLSIGGAVFALDSVWGTRGLVFDGVGVDLAPVIPGMLRTTLTGAVVLEAVVYDSTRRMVADGHLSRSTVAGVPIDTAIGTVRVDSGGIALDTLTVRGLAVSLTASGGLGTQAGRDTIRFSAATDSVGVLESVIERFAGRLPDDAAAERPSGVLRAAGRMSGSLDRFLVIVDLDVERLKRGRLFVSDAGGSLTWVSATRILGLTARVDSLAIGAIAASRVRVSAHGQPDSLRWFAQSRWGVGGWIGGGGWQRDSTGTTIVLDSLGLSLPTGPWFLDSATTVAVSDSGVTVDGLSLRNRIGPGLVVLNGRWPFDGPGRLHGSIDGLQLQDVLVLALQDPGTAEGELSGTFDLAGRARAPEIDLAVSLRNAGYGEFRAPFTRGRLSYRDRRVEGDLDLRRLNTPLLSVTIALPLDLALVDVPRRRLPGRMSVRARADSVDLTLLEATVPQVTNIAGTFDADFGIEGTWEDPRLTGELAIRDGAATIPALGVRHEDMDGRLRLSGDTVYVEDLTLRSGRGRAEVLGAIVLQELSQPVLDLRIRGQDFRVIDVRNYLTLAASGDMRLAGPLYQARLGGNATATRGVLYFADLLTKNVVNLEDTLFAEFVDTALVRSEGLGAEFQSRFLDSLRIDSLRVDMGQEFWLRSTEANVQLAGNVFVSKARDRYRLDGTLEAPRGTYRLEIALGTSREFRVTRGQIRYLGTPDLNADLDIDAYHVVRSVRTTTGVEDTVYVHIGGSLYDPRVRLSSSYRPALAEPEIISLLLFGAPTVAQGTSSEGFEARVLAQWLSTTVSGQLEYALISDLGVPLDYLQIRPTTGATGLTGAEIAVGKQFRVLGTTAFLTASPRYCRNQATSLASVGASLEFRLSRHWLVAASVDPLFSCENPTAPSAANYQFGADLFWEKSY